MSKANPICRVCGVVLDSKNWHVSHQKYGNRICKGCNREYHIQHSRKQGVLPFSKNKECSLYLGCHIAERIVSHAFKDAETMPHGNRGFDIICNHEKLIDVKSSCVRKRGDWGFRIDCNTTADYFLCLAFDNIEDLNLLYAWLIPRNKLNCLRSTSIRPSTIHKWDEYKIDISKILKCCDGLRK